MLVHLRVVGVVLGRHDLYSSHRRALLISSYILRGKKEGLSGCILKRSGEKN